MFCTYCGLRIEQAVAFCTSCGAKQNHVSSTDKVRPTSVETPLANSVLENSNNPTSDSRRPRIRLGLAFALAILVSLAAGVGIAGANKAEFAIGKRFTESQLKRAVVTANEAGREAGQKEGYSEGYDSGKTAGYQDGQSDGQSDGYSSGFDDGCNHVFDKIGENLIAIRSPWFSTNVYGYYWPRADVC